jgi:hypothetical protein
MKGLLIFLFLNLLAIMQCTQMIAQQPITIGVCQLLEDSARLNGKLVQVRGEFQRALEWSAILGKGCEGGILVVDPAHPSVHPRPDFRIKEDKAWREFQNVSQERLAAEPNSVCVGPCGRYRYDVVATFVGRVDSGEVQNRAGKLEQQTSYGHLGQFRVRLVLKSVSDVVATPTVKPD